MQQEPIKDILEDHIQLRKDLIQNFIKREFGGNKAAFGRSLELQDLPHRKTILRWASGEDTTLPKGSKRLLALAQALDVDPFMLLDIPSDIFIKASQRASWNLSWGSIHKSLAFLNDLFKLSDEVWPPPHIADLFEGEWNRFDFTHCPQKNGRNFFHQLSIEPEGVYGPEGDFLGPRDPQLWYFSFREIRWIENDYEPCGFWRPYGIVYIYQGHFTLLHLTGMLSQVPIQDKQGRFILENYFGQGAAQFRVASLHQFEAEQLSDASKEHDLPVLRFGFPE